MIEDLIDLLVFTGWLIASIWLIRKAFREKRENLVAKVKGVKKRGVRWGFGYQFMLGLLSLCVSSAGFAATLYLLISNFRK